MSSKSSTFTTLHDVQPIVLGDYADGVRIQAAYMKPLAQMLTNAAPSDLGPREKKQLGLIVEIARHGDDVIDERQSVGPTRPAFIDFGNAWGGLHDALVAKSRLPASLSDKGPRAATLLDQIFPDGIMFIRRDAHAAWSDGDRRFSKIVDDDLKREIDAVVGDELFDAVKIATAALGEALGVGRTRRETPRTTDLQSTVARFSRETARYARMLAGDVDTSDPASVERFRKAVAAPIDALRSRRNLAPETGADPASPASPTTGTGDAPAGPSAPPNGA